MIKIIRVRKECPEIGWGHWTSMTTEVPEVLALCYSWRSNRVVALHNFSREPQEVTLRLDGDDGGLLVSLLDLDDSRVGKSGRHRISLPAYGYRWYRVGGLNYALRRTPAAEAAKVRP
jgi:maltose alpha-D-glucosyltransferase/alpha-amylase